MSLPAATQFRPTTRMRLVSGITCQHRPKINDPIWDCCPEYLGPVSEPHHRRADTPGVRGDPSPFATGPLYRNMPLYNADGPYDPTPSLEQHATIMPDAN